MILMNNEDLCVKYDFKNNYIRYWELDFIDEIFEKYDDL